MKKIVSIALVLVLMLSFVGCGSKKESEANAPKADVVITESGYRTYMDDLTANPTNYIGKTIQIEGMYTLQDLTQQGGKIYYFVYRNGVASCPTCPANMCGLEFTTADNKYPDYTPKNEDTDADHPWIRVTGSFDQYFEGETGPYFTLRNATYEVLTTRGKTNV